MQKLIIIFSVLTLTACAAPKGDNYGAGFAVATESTWNDDYDTPYPFTVPSGEISCITHPKFGREVYFEPEGFTDESYVGTPLNKTAVNALERNGMASNVPYSIKKGADLSEAVEIGLRVCGEQ